jgi:tRNA A37 threonylcarbamoyladenosine modification protein TsaB
MNILTIKTDVVTAEIGLWNEKELLNSEKWEAHRQLAHTLHIKMKNLLKAQHLGWADIDGLVVY